MEQEIWKPVKGFENIYMVSNYGALKSLSRSVPRIVPKWSNKKPYMNLKGKIITGTLNADGYLFLKLSSGKNKRYVGMHVLVAENFLVKQLHHTEVNHLDAVKTNNKASNLEWCSHLENMQHAASLKLLNNTGSNNPRAILNENQVLEIKAMLRNGGRVGEIAKIYNVNRLSIGDIKQGRSWKHV